MCLSVSWHFHKSNSIGEYMNSQMLETMWATFEPSIISRSNSHRDGTNSMVSCFWRRSNPPTPDTSVWRPGCAFELWVLLSKRARCLNGTLLGFFRIFVELFKRSVSFWQFVPQIWSLLGTLSTPMNSANCWCFHTGSCYNDLLLLLTVQLTRCLMTRLLQADRTWYNTKCLTFSRSESHIYIFDIKQTWRNSLAPWETQHLRFKSFPWHHLAIEHGTEKAISLLGSHDHRWVLMA